MMSLNQGAGASRREFSDGSREEEDTEGAIAGLGADIPLDRITRVVATHFGCPAYINIVDGSSERCISSSTGKIHMIGLDLSICVQVVRTGKPHIIADLKQDPRMVNHPFVQGRAGWRAFAGVPLRINGKVEGVLCVIDTDRRQFDEYDMDVLARFGNVAAEVLRNQVSADSPYRIPDISRHMIDGLPDATFVLSEAGSIIYRNKAAEWDFVDPDVADWSALWPGSVLPAALAALDRALEYGESQFEAHITAGEAVPEFNLWYDIRLKRTEIEGQVMLLATARDVALRRMVETALIENETRWRETVNSLPEALIIVDERDEILYVNSAAIKLLGADRASSALGRKAREFFPTYNGRLSNKPAFETVIRQPAGATRRVIVRSQPSKAWGNGRTQFVLKEAE